MPITTLILNKRYQESDVYFPKFNKKLEGTFLKLTIDFGVGLEYLSKQKIYRQIAQFSLNIL